MSRLLAIWDFLRWPAVLGLLIGLLVLQIFPELNPRHTSVPTNAFRQQLPGEGTRPSYAEAVRRACVEAAVQAAEDAGIRGLCADGQLQAAIDSMRSLRVEDFVGDS